MDGRPDVARGWRLAAWTLCAIGAAARIAAYAQHRSLWYDEAALALNIAGRGFVGLFTPLDYLQTAPPLFLWAERAAVVLFGVNEWSLRAIPLVAGVATAPAMWRVGRRLLPEPAALLAVALVALSPSLVRYAAEVKPYATDALLTLLILDRAMAARADSHSAGWRGLALTGFAAVLFSTPAVFVLAGVIAFMATSALIAKDMGWGRRTAALAAGWAGGFLLLLATVFRPLLTDTTPIGKFMQWYWAANFLTPEPPGIVAKALALLWSALTNTFLGVAAFRGATSLLLGAVIVGLVALIATRKTPHALLLVVPVALLAVASALRRYPIAERLILFAAPLSALLIASSQLVLAHPRAHWASGWMAGALTVAVVGLAGQGTVARLRSDLGRQESRDLVRNAALKHATGVPLWISGGGEVAWRFYSTVAGAGASRAQQEATAAVGGRALEADLLVGAWYASPPERILAVSDDTAAAAKPSTWSTSEATRVRVLSRPCALLLFTHVAPGEVSALLTSVAQIGGRVRESRRAPGAELHDVCFAADSVNQRSAVRQ